MISHRTHDALRAWSLGLSVGCVTVYLASALVRGGYPESVLATAVGVTIAAGILGFADARHPRRVAGSIFLGVVIFVGGRLLYDGATGRYHHPAPWTELGLGLLVGLLPALLGAFAASTLRRALKAKKSK